MNKEILFLFLLVSFLTTCSKSKFPDEPIELSPVSSFGSSFQSVHSPLENEVWTKGSEHKIVWSSSQNISVIRIDLYKKEAFQRSVILLLDNSGSFVWTVPKDLQQSHHYKLKIMDAYNWDDFIITPSVYIPE